MRHIPLVVLLAACGKPYVPVDTDDTDEVIDTDVPDPDADGDGFLASQDCNDADERVNPRAEEACDGIDNDCDSLTDEDQDVDLDGYLPVDRCPGGDDCDDVDATRHPDAAEVPYNGIDEDCDGADLVDVDGDTYKGADAGGSDCNDTDPTINAAAEEIPKDGIDNDCKDGDDLDGDDDGYDDVAFGGTDCADENDRIHPGGVDYNGDGIDQDCSGRDGGTVDLEDAGIMISGNTGSQDLFGYDLAACDVDEDGRDDLIISAPFAGSYQGKLLIYFGSNSEDWSTTMTATEADVELVGSSAMFFGMGVACGDVDGDGHLDLVTARGEIHAPPSYDTDFSLLLFYGDGTGFTWASSDRYAEAELTWMLGAPSGEYTVYSSDFTIADVDGDGAGEILLDVVSIDTDTSNGLLAALPGGRWEDDAALPDLVGWTMEGDSPNSIATMAVVPDLDGDGASELYVGQDYTADPTATDPSVPGRASFVTAGGGDTVADAAWLSVDGSDDEAFGSPIAAEDFDGDGAVDLVVGARNYAGLDTDAGALYFYSDATTWLDEGFTASAYTSLIAADDDTGHFGWTMAVVGDADGDGTNDLLVGQEDEDGKGRGQVYLLGGSRLATSSTPEDAAILVLRGERPSLSTSAETSSALAVGDFDGDGHPELVIGAYTYPTTSGTREVTTGRVYVLPTW